MNRSDILQYFALSVKSLLPEEYNDVELKVTEFKKLNTSYTGLMVKIPGESNCPVIKLEKIDGMISMNISPAAIVETFAREFADDVIELCNNTKTKKVVDSGFSEWVQNYELVKPRLFLRLSNYEANAEYLESVPHNVFNDLAITCHILVNRSNEGSIASTVINKKLMESYGITFDKLYADALENSQKLFPEKIETMSDVMRKMGMGDDAKGSDVIVLSTEAMIDGAAAILYPRTQKKLDAMIGDYFIVPSSIHELLIFPDTGDLNPTELLDMVRSVNSMVIAPEDKLSDNIYVYNSSDMSFDLITKETTPLREYDIGKSVSEQKRKLHS